MYEFSASSSTTADNPTKHCPRRKDKEKSVLRKPASIKTRNEIKEEAKKKKSADKLVKDMNSLLYTVRRHPELWSKPEFETLRSFVNDVSSNPLAYPPVNPTLQLNAGDTLSQLTKGLASALYDSDTTPLPMAADGRLVSPFVVQVHSLLSKVIKFQS